MKRCMLLRPLLWVLPLLITALLPPASSAQEKKSLRIVFVSLSWNNQLPFRIAIAKGFFKDQGLTVEQIFVRGGPTAIAALVSGNVDFASIGGAQAPIRSNARGLDLQIIASLSNFTNYALLGSTEAKNVEELRGKVIGVTGAGAFSDFAIRIFLKETQPRSRQGRHPAGDRRNRFAGHRARKGHHRRRAVYRRGYDPIAR